MTTRRDLLSILGLGAFSAAVPSFAQQPRVRVARIGYLGSATASGEAARVETLRAGLRELGYVEGKNIVIEYRWAEEDFDRLPELAAELARLKPDLIVTYASPGVRSAKQASTTIPIVMAASADAVATGLVESLARPGGNVTGSTILSPEVAVKRLELLKTTLPRIARAAVLLRLGNPANEPVLPAMERAAGLLKVALTRFAVRGPKEFEGAFAAMIRARADGVVITDDPMLNINAKMLADIAAKKLFPCAGTNEFAKAGGLIGYGVIPGDMWRRAAVFVDKILKGAKPAELPVEQATRFELVINLRAAKALRIAFPQPVLARADRVIE